MLRSLLIAIAAALLVGAAVTRPAEAQGWTCTYDFSTGQNGWTFANNAYDGDPEASYSSGAFRHADVNLASNSHRRMLVISLTFSSTTITNYSVSNSYTYGSGTINNRARLYVGGTTVYDSGSSNPPSTINWTGSNTATTVSMNIISSIQSTATFAGSISVTSITLQGTGTAPCAATPTPTLTPSNTPVPTATNTPLPTATPVAYPTDAPFIGAQGDSYWGNTYNMTYGLQGWSLISGTLGGGRVVSADVGGTQRLEMEYPLGNVKVTDVFANYEASCAHTFEVKDGNTVFEAGSVGSGMQALVWQGEHVMTNGSLKISLVGGSGCDVSAFQLYEITIMGYGANPTNLEATAIAFEAGNLYSGLSDVNTLLESLPASINSGVPDETGRTLFGYAKWLISPSSADELAGPFAPIVSHTGIFVSLTFALVLVYAIVWAAVWIFRFVVWLFRIILQIIQVVVSVIGSIFKFFF